MNNTPHLPFLPFSVTLREVLRDTYLKGAAEWLLGDNPSGILAQVSNSAWEASFSVLFLIDLANIYEKDGNNQSLQDTIKLKSTSVARWLVLRKNSENEDGHINWDNTTWDTAVVIRGLIAIYIKYATSFSPDENKEFITCAKKGMEWLYMRFVN